MSTKTTFFTMAIAQKSPLEQLQEAEEYEQRRIEKVREQLAQDLVHKLKHVQEAAQNEEENARSAAEQEVQSFADSEFIALLQRAQDEAVKEGNAVRQSAEKKEKQVVT